MTLVVALPARPDPDDHRAHWWRLDGGAVIASGDDADWTVPEPAALRRLLALAPAAAVRLARHPREGSAPRQAAAVAAVQAIAGSLGDPATLHTAAALPGEGAEWIDVAVVSNGTMTLWLDWLAAAGADPDAIVPAALLLPRDPDGWQRATIGEERIVARGDLAFPDEEGLAALLIGDAPVADVPATTVQTAIARVAEAAPLNLRSGRFARKRRFRIDRARLLQLALLLALLPLISLLIALASLAKLSVAAAQLDAASAASASALLGRDVTADDAEAELEALAMGTPGAGGTLSVPLAALWSRLQWDDGVALTQLGWRRDGTLSVTLAAPRAEPVNRVLIALQRDGYTVSAVPRQAPDGRTLADVTIRTMP